MEIVEKDKELFFFSNGKRNGGIVFHHNGISPIRFDKMVKIGHINQMGFVCPEKIIRTEQGFILLEIGGNNEFWGIDKMKRGIIFIGFTVNNILNIDRVNFVRGFKYEFLKLSGTFQIGK